MDLRHVIARDDSKKSVTMRLYGPLGPDQGETNGHYFAQEIAYISDNYDNIDLRVNCEGGRVLHGISIFNALLSSTAYVKVTIEGLAASMGGFLCFGADEIVMNDFARLMIHDPFYPEKGETLTAKEKKALASFSGMLAQVTAKRCGDVAKAAEYMKAETWFTAEEAKAAGLIDEIITTGKAQDVAAQLSGIAALTSEVFENYLPKTETDMKLIASMFGLAETATEAEIIAKINEERAAASTATTERDEMKAELDAFKAEKEAALTASVEALADTAITSGNFKAEMKADLIAMGKANPETFKKMVEGLQPVVASLSAELQAKAGEKGAQKLPDAEEFERLRREDPEALAEMKVEDAPRFARLMAAWEKKYC